MRASHQMGVSRRGASSLRELATALIAPYTALTKRIQDLLADMCSVGVLL